MNKTDKINIIFSDSSILDGTITDNFFNVLYDYGYSDILHELDVQLIICSNINKIAKYKEKYNIPVFFAYPTYDIDADNIVINHEKLILDAKDLADRDNFKQIFSTNMLYAKYDNVLYNNFNFINFEESSSTPIKLEHYKFTKKYLLSRINAYLNTSVFDGYDYDIENWLSKDSTKVFLREFDTLILVSTYPSPEAYASYGFVHRRVISYLKEGKKCMVFLIGKEVKETTYMIDGVIVTGEKNIALETVLSNYNIKNIITHSFTARNYNSIFLKFLKKDLINNRLTIFSHGSDIMSGWRRFSDVTISKYYWYYNLTKRRQLQWRNFLSAINNSKKVINKDNVNIIFVSEYLRNVTYKDISKELFEPYSHVVHNYIDSETFSYEAKSAEQRYNILAIRSFKSRTYANDILAKVILKLSKHPQFRKMNFLIVGSGELLEKYKDKLKKFPNVTFDDKFKSQTEIAKIHKDYGIFLSPSRMDTQGVNRDEAMSSGLVAIANDVGGTKEFINNDVGYLVSKNDYKEMARAIIELIEKPDVFTRKSAISAKHVREISGYNNTIVKELEYIYGKKQ